MATVDNFALPHLTFEEIADPDSVPASDAGTRRLVVDDAGGLWLVDSTGTATPATGGSGASDAADVAFTPGGTIAATDVQTALSELDTELPARISSAISAVVAGAPGALDTLDELAAALGDDANYASTVTTALAAKLAKASNLSDLANAGTARTNLGLGTAAVLDAPSSGNASSSQVVKGNDTRLGGAGAGTILGIAEATASAAYATTSTTDADVDATNLSVSFTVPASGAVLVRLSGITFSSSGALDVWTVRESTTTVAQGQPGGQNSTGRAVLEVRITGLTPGASKTYKFGHWRSISGTSTIYTGGNSGTYGNVIMQVIQL